MSVIVTIVLLNELLMCTTPVVMFLRSRLRGRRPPGFAFAIDYFLTAFFLLATVRFGPLRVRALVWVRWPRTGQPLAVPDALQAPDLDLALDVVLDVAAQVTFDA